MRPKIMIEGIAIKVGKEVFALPRGYRHHHAIGYLSSAGYPAEVIAECEQGFVVTGDRFVSRVEAYEVARVSGQIKYRPKLKELFSEDLW